MTRATRRRHDVAYLCFLPAVLVALLVTALALVPLSTGTAGGLGLLVLVPLSLVALAALPMGLYLALRHRHDRALLTLALATLALLALVMTEAGAPAWRNAATAAYVVLALVIELSWLSRRRAGVRQEPEP